MLLGSGRNRKLGIVEARMPEEENAVTTGNSCRGLKHGGEAVYALGFVGAAVYFVTHASTFWLGVLGILKAIVWPALLVFKLLQFLHL
jgi:hypothetical protein